jgi:hypothetical protein
MRKPRNGYRSADPYENVLKYLLAAQAEDGHWDSGGQSTNPPEVSTAWALLAIDARQRWMTGEGPASPRKSAPSIEKLIKANDEAIAKAREKGQAFLGKAGNGSPKALVMNEWFIVRLLMERRTGKPEQVKSRIDDLLALQHKDGGWSVQLSKDASAVSDAYATGQSLYALSVAGVGTDSEPVQKALRFLTTTQQEDGSWKMGAGTFHAPPDKPARVTSLETIYRHWGTCWAVLGMEGMMTKQEAAPAVVK